MFGCLWTLLRTIISLLRIITGPYRCFTVITTQLLLNGTDIIAANVSVSRQRLAVHQQTLTPAVVFKASCRVVERDNLLENHGVKQSQCGRCSFVCVLVADKLTYSVLSCSAPIGTDVYCEEILKRHQAWGNTQVRRTKSNTSASVRTKTRLQLVFHLQLRIGTKFIPVVSLQCSAAFSSCA